MATPLESVACNLCGSTEVRHVVSQRDLLNGDETDFSVVECVACGLMYVLPRPVREVMGRYYPPYFVSYQFEVGASAGRGLRARTIAAISRSIARERVKALGRYLNSPASLRVLDIGCGKGAFLAELRRRYGCTVQGLDFDEGSVVYCREQLKIDATVGDAHVIDQLGHGFDVVTLWHVLEHDHDPSALLHSVWGCLATGGVVVVEVPNQQALENRLFGSRSYLYDLPRHLYHFSEMTLSRLLRDQGFSVISVTQPTGAGGWLGSVQQLLAGGRVYRNLHDHAFTLVGLGALLVPVDWLTCALGQGSILRVVARKVE